MQQGKVTGGEGAGDGGRSELAEEVWRGDGGQIAGGRPGMEAAVEEEVWGVIRRDQDAVGEDEGMISTEAFGVQGGVEVGEAGDALAVGFVPEFEEAVSGGSAAFDAGTMAGGQGGGFVEKEEFGPQTRRHDGVPSTFELQHATDPALELEGSDELALRIDEAAAVAHQRAPFGDGFDFTIRVNAIL